MDKMLGMFKVFGLGYFIYLLIVIAIVVTLVLTLRKLSDKAQNITKIVLISSMGLFLLIEYISRLIGVDKVRLGDQLPIEIFDVFVGISVFIFFSKNTSWKKFAYLIIAPISLYGLIFVPNMYAQFETVSLCVISYYILQALLIANAILNMLWDEEELEKKDILISSMNFVIILSIAHLTNVFLQFTAWGVHANYFGTMGEKFDTLIGWLYKLIPVPFVCLLPLIALLVGVEFLLILPFDLIKTKKQKQSHIEELIALGNLKEQQEYRKKHKTSKSQILVRSATKATPQKQKNVKNSSNESFVATTKEVKVNKENDNKK